MRWQLTAESWERENVTESESDAEQQAIETRRSIELRNSDEDVKGRLERDHQCTDHRRDALTREGVPEHVDFALPWDSTGWSAVSVRRERVRDDRSCRSMLGSPLKQWTREAEQRANEACLAADMQA